MNCTKTKVLCIYILTDNGWLLGMSLNKSNKSPLSIYLLVLVFYAGYAAKDIIEIYTSKLCV